VDENALRNAHQSYYVTSLPLLLLPTQNGFSLFKKESEAIWLFLSALTTSGAWVERRWLRLCRKALTKPRIITTFFFFFAISFSSNCRKRETQFSSAEYHIRSITLELIPNVFLSLPTSGGESKGGQTTWQQTTVHRRAAANNGWYFHVIWRSYASCVAIGKRIIKRLIA
jgi:hypothetical protein